MIFSHLFATALLMAAPDVDWRAELQAGKQAWQKQDAAGALARLTAAAEAAPATELEPVRLLSAVYRLQGNYPQAEKTLERAIEQAPNASHEQALLLGELAAVQRAQNRVEQALATVERAVQIRETQPEPHRGELARALTMAATLRQQLGDTAKVVEMLKRALEHWNAALAPGDPQCLPALEALANAYRDGAQYAEAAPLYLRALKLRESAVGPQSAEVIAIVDSLAYTYFGMKKFPEAEELYKRLLALWENSAGPEHPMVALTLDKMAEFYAFQQRYDVAEKMAQQALELRAKLHVASLNQTGRVLLMEAKLKEAEDLYRRAVKIGDLAQAPDETMDPVLRIYAKVLRELQQPEEADVMDKRAKDALLRKADREGRRPSPVKVPTR